MLTAGYKVLPLGYDERINSVLTLVGKRTSNRKSEFLMLEELKSVPHPNNTWWSKSSTSVSGLALICSMFLGGGALPWMSAPWIDLLPSHNNPNIHERGRQTKGAGQGIVSCPSPLYPVYDRIVDQESNRRIPRMIHVSIKSRCLPVCRLSQTIVEKTFYRFLFDGISLLSSAHRNLFLISLLLQ